MISDSKVVKSEREKHVGVKNWDFSLVEKIGWEYTAVGKGVSGVRCACLGENENASRTHTDRSKPPLPSNHKEWCFFERS